MKEVLALMNPWWEGEWKATGVRRGRYVQLLLDSADRREVCALVGLRRVGKTTILRQCIGELLQKTPPSRILYVTLDHPFFERHSIMDIVAAYRTLHRLGRKERVFLFIDEAHTKPGWEKEVKALHDTEEVKVYLSGSSSLLLKQAGSYLTGRMRTYIVRPLDFGEFLQFTGKAAGAAEGYLEDRWVEDYLKTGGMPEFVLGGDISLLTELVDAIITKDLVAAHRIKNPSMAKELLVALAQHISSRTSYHKLARIFGVKTETIQEYLSYLEEAFLVFSVKKSSTSFNDRIYAPKKFYLADLGIRTALIGFRDMGALAENAVFLKLVERHPDIFYYRNGGEVDFVVKENGLLPIEVKWETDVFPAGLEAFLDCHQKAKGVLVVGRGRFPPAPARAKVLPLKEFLRHTEI